MKAKELRELNDEELQRRLDETYKEYLNLRFRHATRQLTNTSELRKARKNIARIKTILHERVLAAEAS